MTKKSQKNNKNLIILSVLIILTIFLAPKLKDLTGRAIEITTDCTETDGGMIPYVKGTANGQVAITSTTYTEEVYTKADTCLVQYPDRVSEYHCENNIVFLSSSICDNGCADGACICDETNTETTDDCPTDYVCISGKCECKPKTCLNKYPQCGSVLPDDCGGTIDCGCPTGEVCSSGSCILETTTITIDSEPNLITYYKFDDNTQDSSGNNYHAQDYSKNYLTGEYDKAILFRGGSEPTYATRTLPPELNNPTQLSVTVWIKPSSLETTRIIVEKYGLANIYDVGWIVMLVGNKFQASFDDQPTLAKSPLRSTKELIPNVWYHVATTWDGTTQRNYINGVEDGTLPVTILRNKGTNIVIGSRLNQGPKFTFDGAIDELKIYNKALTAQEIQTIYEYVQTTTVKSVEICGDGVLDESEECDDGNKVDGDGCSATCKLETQTTCTDSDGGNEYYLLGTTSGSLSTDPIIIRDFNDVCIEGIPVLDGWIKEYICSNNLVIEKSTECPNGCQEGVCICDETNELIEDDCPEGYTCDDGTCKIETQTTCTPDCTDKYCGDNGCGGSCGTCTAAGETCVDGECIIEIPTCTDQCILGEKKCLVSAYKICIDPPTSICLEWSPLILCPTGETCVDGECVQCTPNCIDKYCGSDGCTGICGECAQDEVCVDYQCEEKCVDGDATAEDSPYYYQSSTTGKDVDGIYRDELDWCNSDGDLVEYICVDNKLSSEFIDPITINENAVCEDGRIRIPTCGDSIVDEGEECDDYNTISGDGCSAICEIEEILPEECPENHCEYYPNSELICIPYGLEAAEQKIRLETEYCGDTGPVQFKSDDDNCVYDYECESNICWEGTCISYTTLRGVYCESLEGVNRVLCELCGDTILNPITDIETGLIAFGLTADLAEDEECDSTDLVNPFNTLTCTDFSAEDTTPYTSGDLYCNSLCQIDTSGCSYE